MEACRGYGAFLGHLASVVDEERRAITIATVQETAETAFVLRQSQEVLPAALILRRGNPPR